MESKIFLEKIVAIISNHTSCITENGRITDDFYKFGNIPEKKLANARVSYSFDMADEPLALIDATLFGSAINGMIIGVKGIYFNNEDAFKSVRNFLSWKEMAETNFQIRKPLLSDIEILPSCFFNMSGSNMKRDVLIDLLTKITLCYKESYDNENILKLNSFFFRFKKEFMADLAKGIFNKKGTALNSDLYDSCLFLSSNFKNSKHYNEKDLYVMYRDDIIFQSFILSSFFVYNMLSKHLTENKITDILSSQKLIIISYAKFKAIPKKPEEKTLANVISPLNNLLEIENSEEILNYKKLRNIYFSKYTESDSSNSSFNGDERVCHHFSLEILKILNDFNVINKSYFYHYFYETAQEIMAKTEKILIEYYS